MDFHGDASFAIEYVQWPLSAYHDALRLAGFTAIERVPIGVSSQGVAQMGPEYWTIYRNNLIGMGVIATFAGS